MLDWFRLPGSFDATLWLSQILQAMAMKYAVEHWRRSMPRGMGTLYWQINDCWPVASWSSIDYHGRWKALHFMARRFYQPVLVSGLEDAAAGTIALHVTNDLREAVTGKLTWLATDAAGRRMASGARSVTAGPLGDTAVGVISLATVIGKKGAHDVLVWLDFKPDAGDTCDNLVLFARPKHLELLNPKIKVAVRDLKDGSFEVTLNAVAPALWTWIELEGEEMRVSDNFVHLSAGRPGKMILTPARSLTLSAVRKAIKVQSLVDTF